AVTLIVDHADACTVDHGELRSLFDRCPQLVVVLATAAALRGEVDALGLLPLAVPPRYARHEEILAAPSARLFARRAERVNAGFRGPFTFDPAFVVSGAPAGAVLDDLGTLIDLRLVEPLLDDGAEPTFAMLPLVRSFVLDDTDAAECEANRERRSAFLRELVR